jgi:two-component sensor histidine kinase
VSIGLIVTERLINAVKHAFPAGRSGNIRVKYDVRGPEWRLSVSDDGVGRVPTDAGHLAAGLGTSIVEVLATNLTRGLRSPADRRARS